MEWTDEVWKFTELNGREIMVSSHGRVIGFKGRIIKPQLMQTGYYVFKYWNGRHVSNIEIHRLVAKAFIPNPENKPEIDHIDTVRTNNHVNNAKYVMLAEQYLPEDFKVKEIRVEYKLAVIEGDSLHPRVTVEDDKVTVVLVNDSGNAFATVLFLNK